jgi:hypothetical protein
MLSRELGDNDEGDMGGKTRRLMVLERERGGGVGTKLDRRRSRCTRDDIKGSWFGSLPHVDGPGMLKDFLVLVLVLVMVCVSSGIRRSMRAAAGFAVLTATAPMTGSVQSCGLQLCLLPLLGWTIT